VSFLIMFWECFERFLGGVGFQERFWKFSCLLPSDKNRLAFRFARVSLCM
jgi:hypothetical protein